MKDYTYNAFRHCFNAAFGVLKSFALNSQLGILHKMSLDCLPQGDRVSDRGCFCARELLPFLIAGLGWIMSLHLQQKKTREIPRVVARHNVERLEGNKETLQTEFEVSFRTAFSWTSRALKDLLNFASLISLIFASTTFSNL